MTELKNRVIEVYTQGRLQRLTSMEIYDRYVKFVRDEVMSHTRSGRRRYSEWLSGYVNGVRDMCSDELYRHHLEYLYRIDGVFYTTNRQSTIFESVDKFYGTPEVSKIGQSDYHGHFWANTTKPFFIGVMPCPQQQPAFISPLPSV